MFALVRAYTSAKGYMMNNVRSITRKHPKSRHGHGARGPRGPVRHRLERGRVSLQETGGRGGGRGGGDDFGGALLPPREPPRPAPAPSPVAKSGEGRRRSPPRGHPYLLSVFVYSKLARLATTKILPQKRGEKRKQIPEHSCGSIWWCLCYLFFGTSRL